MTFDAATLVSKRRLPEESQLEKRYGTLHIYGNSFRFRTRRQP
jgi:hypothetical protein